MLRVDIALLSQLWAVISDHLVKGVIPQVPRYVTTDTDYRVAWLPDDADWEDVVTTLWT
jgi:hypothetical protein